jgi:hypothetical protein
LHQDPSGVTLSADQLNQYSGAYSIAPGHAVTIVRDGDALRRISDAGNDLLHAEVRDIFFAPGSPSGYARRRIIFHRDVSGRVSSYETAGLVFTRTQSTGEQNGNTVPAAPTPGRLVLRSFVVHRSGDVAVATFFHDRDTNYYGRLMHETFRSSESWVLRGTEWKMIASQGRLLQRDPLAVILPSDELKSYVGIYAAGPLLTVVISREGNALAASVNHKKAVPLQAEASGVFFTPASPLTEIIFQRSASGRVTGYLNLRDERDLLFIRKKHDPSHSKAR